MSDQDEPPVEDASVAADRLERALERIAAAAHRGAPPPDGEARMLPGAVAERLDGLLARLREALGPN